MSANQRSNYQSRLNRQDLYVYPHRYSMPSSLRWPKRDRKSTRLNSSHSQISYAVFCLKKQNAHTLQASVLPAATRTSAGVVITATCPYAHAACCGVAYQAHPHIEYV